MAAPASEFLHYPRPKDDGAARALEGRRLPNVELQSTRGDAMDVGGFAGRLVLYLYPSATGTTDLPTPDWATIPGAIGCTAESCAFRDRLRSFATAGATVVGVSAQTSEAQAAFAARKGINFPLLSDTELTLAEELDLPTFRAGELELYRRLTLVADSGRIVKVFYPVFPPDTHPAEVLAWLEGHPQGRD